MHHVLTPPDATAKIVLGNGHLIVYYDEDRNEVVIQSDAKGSMLVRPRASNSIAITIEKSA